MREFKFIRGKYTDENIFNSDETNNCLFAYDSEGNLVEFTEKNDKEFQDKFAGLSSDRLSEIYTLRPSQFTISAEQKSDDSYDFTFTADEKVYDGSRQFPTKVIQKAEKLIKANTTGEFNTESKLPILNLDSAAKQKTPTTFTFKDKPSFTRNLVFKVSGSLNERGYTTAQGENIEEVYKTANGKIDYNSGVVRGTFYGGRLQQIVNPVVKTVVSAGKVVNENDDDLTVASNYTPANGYAFICGDDNSKHFDNEINYGESSAFDLYKQLSYYLEEVNAADAVTISKTFANTTSKKYTLNNSNKFMSFNGSSPITGTTYYEEDTSSSNTDPIYASKVNNAPDAMLDASTIEFVSSDAITVSPVEKLIADANMSSGNVIFDAITVGSNQLAYVKEGSAWTPVKSQVNVKFFVNDKKVTSFTKKGTNIYIIIDEDGGSTNFADNISCTMTYNGDTVSAFKYFDKSSQNKYIVMANISSYLDGQATAGDFTKMKVSVINTSYNINSGYVACDKNINLSTVYDNSLNTFYEYDEAKLTGSIDSTNFKFYRKVEANAYIFKKHFTVPAYDANTIVKGYNNSYSGLFIRDGNTLRGLKDGDLTGNSISVYTKSDYHLFANGVYENKSSDTTNYVMWSKDWQSVAINSSNASVRNTDNAISPVITNEVFRLIDTVNVSATQSD